MRPFEYVAATDVDEAARTVSADAGARFIAGGTTLVDLMKLNVETPHKLVDLNPLVRRDKSLEAITELPGGGLRIGAMVRNSDLGWSAVVKQRYPVLSEAVLAGASGQIRNMATVGGNLLQRTRCYYFRDTAMPCNKREPGSGCSAIEGHNRIHAVLGTSDRCIATHPSDMAVAMAALDAVVLVQGPQGKRSIPLVDFHVVPGDHPERETVLKQGEVITAVELPALRFAGRSHYRKVRDRASFAFALASAAVALDLVGDTIRDVRIALGGVGTKPWRAREAERALMGKTASPNNYRAAAELALKDAVPRRENGFKVELAKRTLVRALTTTAAMG